MTVMELMKHSLTYNLPIHIYDWILPLHLGSFTDLVGSNKEKCQGGVRALGCYEGITWVYKSKPTQ